MSADHPEDTNHGDSIAAWTSVTIITVASGVGTYGWVINDSGLLIVSAIGAVVGIAAGPLLKALGFGLKK